MDNKTFTIFSWLQKGFTNSFSILPLLKELYEEVEKITQDELDELSKKHPKIVEIFYKIKALIA